MKKNIVKFFVFILVFTLPFTILTNSYSFTNSHWFTVKVDPPNAGVPAAYEIYGGVSDYDNIDTIVIFFQWTSFRTNYPDKNSILVNGYPASSVFMQSVPDTETSRENLKLTIHLSQRINKGDTIDIKISKAAGIINPVDPRPCYQVAVYLLSSGIEKEYIGSDQYAITQSAVFNVKAEVKPAVIGVHASYKVSFITGVNGLLHAERDDIRIKFPKGTFVPQNPFGNYIYINGHVCSSGIYRDSDDPYVLRIYTPIDIQPNTPVTVVIKKDFGIVNPSSSGKNFIYVSTYQEPTWVKSSSFTLYPPAVRDISIKLSNNVVASNVYAKLNFVTSPIGYLKKGKNIYIKFPKEFSFNGLLGSGSVIVDGVEAKKVVFDNGLLLIQTPIDLSANKSIEILIKTKAGLKLPEKPGKYKISIYTDTDRTVSYTTVDVLPSFIEDVRFTPEYTGINLVSSYSISFKTGSMGNLVANSDYIYVKFDSGFEVPDKIPNGAISVNGVNANNVSVDVYKVLSIQVPVNIKPLTKVDVNISDKAGIKNPTKIGSYGITVYTSAEKTPVESNKVAFKELPAVSFLVSPKKPDGNNGTYISTPNIELFTPNGVDIYYKLDNGEFKKYLGQKITIPNGKHILYAYAVDSEGNKGPIESRSFIVDTEPPVITFDQGNGNLYVNSNPAIITGHVNEMLSVFKINNEDVQLSKDLSFSFTLHMNADKVPVAIYARDYAGRSVALVMMAYLDTQAPEIELITPKQITTTTSQSSFDISFTVSDNEPLKNCTVAINGENLSPNARGAFSYVANLNDGKNIFDITAKDLAGNETTKEVVIDKVNQVIIRLQIGNKEAFVGDEKVELEAAPTIIKNRTFVPLRFISEAFGAQVKWDGALKVITLNYNYHTIQLQIGSTVVLVDGAIKKLDAPPVIKNSRTLVPIRFIAETFGANVNWDGDTKTITIIYTP